MFRLFAVTVLFALLSACQTTTPAPAAQPSPAASGEAGETVAFAQIQSIVEQRCAACHSTTPTRPGFGAPPAGVNLTTPEQIKTHASRIKARAVVQKNMPTNNLTNMTDEERVLLGQWIDQGANIE
ncbi:MAG: c-type cytochrome [Candidatus Sericytochromatia bacterium]